MQTCAPRRLAACFLPLLNCKTDKKAARIPARFGNFAEDRKAASQACRLAKLGGTIRWRARLEQQRTKEEIHTGLMMSAIHGANPLESKIRDLATAGLGKKAGMVVGVIRGGEQWVAGY